MRLCSGCRTKIEDDVRFCAECQSERHKPVEDSKTHTVSDRIRYAFLYVGERWKRKVQPLAWNRYPCCARCNRLSELVDHIVPAGEAIRQAQESGRYPYDKWAGFYLPSNLQGLCRACHGIKTLEDKTHVGPWPSVIEAADRAPKKRWVF